MRNKIKQFILPVIYSAPIMVFAAEDAPTIKSILEKIRTDILGPVIPIIMIIATIVFLWGVITFITSGGDAEKKNQGRDFIIYGLIGLFVMVAVWGLVTIIADFFGVPPGGGKIPPGPSAMLN